MNRFTKTQQRGHKGTREKIANRVFSADGVVPVPLDLERKGSLYGGAFDFFVFSFRLKLA